MLRDNAVGFFAVALIVASGAVLDTSGSWHRSTDDQPGYAASTFDDAAWEKTPVPAVLAAPAAIDAPVIWYRRPIDAAPAGDLALGVGVIPSAYEVYVDGERVGTNGDVEGRVEGRLAPRSFPIPPHAFDDGHALIALRYVSSGIFVSCRAKSSPPVFSTTWSPLSRCNVFHASYASFASSTYSGV